MSNKRSRRNPKPQPAAPEGERLQKVIAATGLASRRTVEEWIRARRISVNGRVAGLGDRARPGDRIEMDGAPIAVREGPHDARVILYHKPVGELVTRRDPADRPTVFSRLPALRQGKWVAVGRLDYNTSGLLLFTDDGELANRLMHPRYEVEREYAVRVHGTLDPRQLKALRDGVQIDGEPARFERIEASTDDPGDGVNRWYRGVLKEGRNREVRRLLQAVGHRVSRLIRIRYGPQGLPREVPPGTWRELPRAEVEALKHVARRAKIR